MKPPSKRVMRIVRAMPWDRPVGTWFLIEAVLGRERAMSYGARKARHWSEQAIASAERYGYIRRLPSRIRSSAPHKVADRFARRVVKELAWVVSEKGMALAERFATDAHQPPHSEEGCSGAEE